MDQQWPPRDKIVCGSMLDHIMSGSASRCLITQSRTPRSLSCLITQTCRHAVTQTCCLITQSRTPRSFSHVSVGHTASSLRQQLAAPVPSTQTQPWTQNLFRACAEQTLSACAEKSVKSVPRMRSDCTRPGLCLCYTYMPSVSASSHSSRCPLNPDGGQVPSVLSLTLKGRGNGKWRS